MSERRPVAFDASALMEPIDARAAREEAAQRRRTDPQLQVGPAGTVGKVIVWIVVAVTMVFIVGIALLIPDTGGFTTIVIMLPLLAGGLGVGLFRRRLRAVDQRWYRLSRFAAANGMQFFPKITEPPLPGMIFLRHVDGASYEVVRGLQPRLVEIGQYRYTVSNGKTQTTVERGYLAIRVDNLLPHIVLDARANNPLFGSNLPFSPSGKQKLDLEGDFNEHFQLYCPQGYERDAYYLFTPDIMARLVDEAAVLDVELIDNWVFFSAAGALDQLNPEMWEWLFTLTRSMLEKLDQWERWRDDRVMPSITPPGIPVGVPLAGPNAPAPAWRVPPVSAPQQGPPRGPQGTPLPQTVGPASYIAAPGRDLPPAGALQQGRQIPRPPMGVRQDGRRLRGGMRPRMIAMLSFAGLFTIVLLTIIVSTANSVLSSH